MKIPSIAMIISLALSACAAEPSQEIQTAIATYGQQGLTLNSAEEAACLAGLNRDSEIARTLLRPLSFSPYLTSRYAGILYHQGEAGKQAASRIVVFTSAVPARLLVDQIEFACFYDNTPEGKRFIEVRMADLDGGYDIHTGAIHKAFGGTNPLYTWP